MQIKNDLVLILEDNKSYFVVCTANYNDELYAYLLDLSDDDKHIYIKQLKTDNENEIKLEKITDSKIIDKISPLLYKELN